MKLKISLLVAGVVLAGALPASAMSWPAACGSDATQFTVKTDKKQPLPGGPEAGKAEIVFIESLDGDFAGQPTTRFGFDGKWVGAARGPSYFTVSVAPGQYHLCASRQSSIKADKETVGVVTLNAEAGKVYYYDFKITRVVVGSVGRADGGGSGMGGFLPSTPNMTARDPATMDEVNLTALSEWEAQGKLRKAARARSEPKL